MHTTQKMAGKRVLVTGSGTGIGREIALEFGRQGADVVLHFAHDAAGAQSVTEEIQALGHRAKAFQADFDRVDEVVKLGDQSVSFLGGIDCLVNNLRVRFIEVFEQLFDDRRCGVAGELKTVEAKQRTAADVAEVF